MWRSATTKKATKDKKIKKKKEEGRREKASGRERYETCFSGRVCSGGYGGAVVVYSRGG
jgi:hypothetical protein